MCQTIDLQTSKTVQMMDAKESSVAIHDPTVRNRVTQASQIADNVVLNSQQTFEPSITAKKQCSDSNEIDGSGHQENGPAIHGPSAATAAAQMIFSTAHRNLQTNLLNQRVLSVFDEFDEGPRKNNVSVPKIDLSKAFLHSIGQSQAQHFQQQGSYLPRFQKLGIKSKVEQKVDFQMHSQRMTKSEEELMAAIAPVAVSSNIAGSKKRVPGIAVLEIPNRFDIPASQFSQPPYTSRPSTSNHLGLFIGVDVRPETARSSNQHTGPQPHRPTFTRSADSKLSTRGAKVLQSVPSLRVAGVRSSPTNQRTSPLNNTGSHFGDFLSVDVENSFPEIGTHSAIIDEYLKDINLGLPS